MFQVVNSAAKTYYMSAGLVSVNTKHTLARNLGNERDVLI